MREINIYCDESNHLENNPVKLMALGAIYIPKEKKDEISKRIKEIKARHKLSKNFEIKWTKISPAKQQFYVDLIDYFFDDDDLHFRGVLINKNELDHKKFQQTHDDFYYKMYFEMLNKILHPKDQYYIYIDIKDTRGVQKVQKLHDVLCNNIYDFKKDIIKKIQQIRSHESHILQLTDLLLGALQFANREGNESEAKKMIVNRIRERSGYTLQRSTLMKENKMNIFYWHSINNNQ